MFALDALFDHIHQISSNVEISGSLVQCSPISAIVLRVGDLLVVAQSHALAPPYDAPDPILHLGRIPRLAARDARTKLMTRSRCLTKSALRHGELQRRGGHVADGPGRDIMIR
jgi:hypothetical protein